MRRALGVAAVEIRSKGDMTGAASAARTSRPATRSGHGCRPTNPASRPQPDDVLVGVHRDVGVRHQLHSPDAILGTLPGGEEDQRPGGVPAVSRP